MTSRDPSHHRSIGAVVLSAALMLCLVGCQHVPVEKHSTGSPDERLALALARLDTARAVGPNNDTVIDDETVIVDPGTVRSDIEEISVEFPNHIPTLLLNTQLAFEARQYEKAQAYCDRVLRLQPENVFAGILRARLALLDGNAAHARRVLQGQIATSPGVPMLYEVLAGVEYLDGRHTEASVALDSAEALGGEAWRISYHRGLIAERQGARDRAARHYRECLAAAPGWGAARARLTLLDKGR